jgi:tRNA(Arg) A34 adenosine deaminase TadA
MRKRDEKFMQRAIELSKEALKKNSGGPFGAVITRNEEIVAEGMNRVTSINDPTAHAEVNAIRKACKKLNTFQLDDCVIYCSCEPCPMCLGAIYWARLKKGFFACSHEDAAAIDFDDQFIYDEIEKEAGARKIEFKQMMRSHAQQVFQQWKAKDDKIKY